MKQITKDEVLNNRAPIESKKLGSLRGSAIYTRKNREQSKKRRLMAKRSRRINRNK